MMVKTIKEIRQLLALPNAHIWVTSSSRRLVYTDSDNQVQFVVIYKRVFEAILPSLKEESHTAGSYVKLYSFKGAS